jgi:hypothetical protein
MGLVDSFICGPCEVCDKTTWRGGQVECDGAFGVFKSLVRLEGLIRACADASIGHINWAKKARLSFDSCRTSLRFYPQS